MIKLSAREQEVLILFMQKGRVKHVAQSLNSSVNTVRAQKHSIMRKLGATNLVELIRTAIQNGLIDP